ncbi:hypothetical protein BCR36DRAFT_8559 [Piromyces finnis]|uniref:BRO1 domain-containing protein n=1 Tax=Piromyces finnis TaxID=1754191 RepID=A0A1Y1VP93_9FUNG|nr:hypothetical protein BCR36DRAFT_8559 [Piromyces finnis]|eukprot:ORX61235.1 hypothetical protein BCR36DRAFT_8559 [Piromyces finnis]
MSHILPPTPTLGIPQKVTDDIFLVEDLKEFLKKRGESIDDNYLVYIKNLNSLRHDIAGAGKDEIGKNLLLKYLNEVKSFIKKFLKGSKIGNVRFIWY